MGSRTTVTRFDDLDGSSEKVRTVTITLDDRTVEVDLSHANYMEVREFLSPYFDVGRKAPTRLRQFITLVVRQLEK